MPHRWLAGLIAVALWSLAMALDVLRMVGRRNQLRRAGRLVASVPAVVDETAIAVFDLTPLGAGFETNVELAVKQQLTLNATITTDRGCDNVTLPIVVRHVHNIAEQRWRVGGEFGGALPQSLNPLVELCTVEPARRRLVHAAAPDAATGDQVEIVAEPALDGRRMSLRLISLLAVLGAIASAQPGDGSPIAWVISAASILVAAGVLAGSARPRRTKWTDDQSTSSPSPDLAIR